MSRIRACRGCGEIVALAFERPHEKFERMFFEEAEKIGFFKLFSVDDKGMVKLAAGRNDFSPQELNWREENIGNVSNWILKDEDKENSVRTKAQEVVRSAFYQAEQLAKQNVPFEQIIAMVTKLLPQNYPQDQVRGFISRMVERVKGQRPEMAVPQITRIPAIV